jgi:uncharacterized protein YjdB
MKKIQALVVACGIGLAANAQIYGLNPSTDGGFETGIDFPTNNWSVINSTTSVNRWYVNDAAPAYAGARCAVISNSATGYAYTLTSSGTSHFLRDVSVPPGSTSINLSFYWKGQGQIGADRLLVYTAPTSVVPASNVPASPSTALPGATLIWTQTTTSATFVQANVALPSTLAGTSVRLIFTWQSDASGGSSPAVAVDNISFTYECGTPAAITGNGPLCQGGTIALGNVFAGGTWSSATPAVATVTPSGLLTGASAGTSVITYTVGTCQSTAVVTVSPLPDAITGQDTVCLGSTTTFANSVIGGTWTSSYPAIATVLSTSGVVTGVAVGISHITYTMPGGCATTDTVFVVNNPGPITGPSQLCPGTTIVVGCSPAGGRWTSLNPGAASINPVTGSVSGIAADTVRLQYASPFGGCRRFTTITVNPLPAPIVARNVICALKTDTAFDATPGGTWSSLSPSLISINPVTGEFNTLAGGSAIIRYTLATSCAVTKTISVNPQPTPIVMFNGPTNTLYTDTFYVSYQWYHSVFGEVPGGNTFKTAGLYSGSYYVIVTDTLGCSAASTPFTYNTSMNASEIAKNTSLITVYPNPAKGEIFVPSKEVATVIVTSMDGRILINEQNTGKVNISSLSTGVYLVTLFAGNGMRLGSNKLTVE